MQRERGPNLPITPRCLVWPEAAAQAVKHRLRAAGAGRQQQGQQQQGQQLQGQQGAGARAAARSAWGGPALESRADGAFGGARLQATTRRHGLATQAARRGHAPQLRSSRARE